MQTNGHQTLCFNTFESFFFCSIWKNFCLCFRNVVTNDKWHSIVPFRHIPLFHMDRIRISLRVFLYEIMKWPTGKVFVSFHSVPFGSVPFIKFTGIALETVSIHSQFCFYSFYSFYHFDIVISNLIHRLFPKQSFHFTCIHAVHEKVEMWSNSLKSFFFFGFDSNRFWFETKKATLSQLLEKDICGISQI